MQTIGDEFVQLFAKEFYRCESLNDFEGRMAKEFKREIHSRLFNKENAQKKMP